MATILWHRPLLVLCLAAVTTACSGASITLGVPSITVPAESTIGTVCYARGEAAGSGALQVRSATYRAQATYRSDGSLFETSDQVHVRVFGRASAPAQACAASGDEDIELAGPFTLTLDEPKTIVVGEGAAGETLAELVNGGEYWIGVALDGGFALGGQRSITFEGGSVTVTF